MLRDVVEDEPDANAPISHIRGIVDHRIGENALARVNARPEQQPGEPDFAGLHAGREDPPADRQEELALVRIHHVHVMQ